jgi:hypothetical protein
MALMPNLGICLMDQPELQKNWLNPVWKYVKAVSGFVKIPRHARSVVVL